MIEKSVWSFISKDENELFDEEAREAFGVKKDELGDRKKSIIGPIQIIGQNLCSIVKVEQIQPGGPIPIKEVHHKINRFLYSIKLERALLRTKKQLRREADIEPPDLKNFVLLAK